MGTKVDLETSKGTIRVELDEAKAPLSAKNFLEYVDAGHYDGTVFHRVIPGFMIQGGDKAGNGTGDPGYLFQDEIDPSLTFDVSGRLAMANSGPSTNGSQFFITEVPVEQLNGKHTIFGQCDAHTVLLVASIARVARNSDDKPTTPVVINKITIVREGQPMPPEPALPAPAAPAAPTK
jgi:peptidyl-prolyl cis-trans isomerase A (cyclophilin A)